MASFPAKKPASVGYTSWPHLTARKPKTTFSALFSRGHKYSNDVSYKQIGIVGKRDNNKIHYFSFIKLDGDVEKY